MLDKFTHQYSLSKTLRFTLFPVGETAEHIENFESSYLQDVVKQDELRASHYKAIKPLIDDYHRDFIERSLGAPVGKKGEALLVESEFEKAFALYKGWKASLKDRGSKQNKLALKDWEDCQKDLRKKVKNAFDATEGRGNLFKKEFVQKILPAWLEKRGDWEEHREVVESFSKFTGYFTGFNENRENLYVADDKATAIGNRLINENLPRFFDNCLLFEQIASFHKKNTEHPPIDWKGILPPGLETIEEAFAPGFFSTLLTQSGITKYQDLLGGHTDAEGVKHRGLNEVINRYRQDNKIKKSKLPGFRVLYKQILSDIETTSFLPEPFGDDAAMLSELEKFKDISEVKIADLSESIEALKKADTSSTFVKSQGFGAISTALFGSWHALRNAIQYHAENDLYSTKDGVARTKSNLVKVEKFVKKDVFSLDDLHGYLSSYVSTLDEDDEVATLFRALDSEALPINCMVSYFCAQYEEKVVEWKRQATVVSEILALQELSKARRPVSEKFPKGGRGYQQIQAIKVWLDACKELLWVVKPLHLVNGRKPIEIVERDDGFYTDFESAYLALDRPLGLLYDKTRNHLTKKPYSKDKVKLNFESVTTTLLDGWDANKEKDNGNVLFIKDGLYYLGVAAPKQKRLFDYIHTIDDVDSLKKKSEKDELRQEIVVIADADDISTYRKVVYKLLPGPNKMFPKVFFSKKRIGLFEPSDNILRIRNTSSHTKNGAAQSGYSKADFCLSDCHEIIDFFKESVAKHPEWKLYNFKFSDTKKYADISEFYQEVSSQGYKISFDAIKAEYIERCVKEGKLYLFQIYNKDFSTFSKGKPNLHTMYWKAVFEAENLRDVVVKLNGEAKLFFRKHSLKKKELIRHPAGRPLSNKNENNPKKESVFEYELVKDRRFSRDTFLFHVPITLNTKRQSSVSSFQFNQKINTALAKEKGLHVIGIDRGERHLLYYSVINKQGKIVEQGSLNQIETDQGYKVDYQQKLDAKEKERDSARKSWASVENIKELKQGYLSHVVHKLAKLIVKYDAVVCLPPRSG